MIEWFEVRDLKAELRVKKNFVDGTSDMLSSGSKKNEYKKKKNDELEVKWRENEWDTVGVEINEGNFVGLKIE